MKSARFLPVVVCAFLVCFSDSMLQAQPVRSRTVTARKKDTSKIRRKLESIVIPKVNFEEATITEVIEYLQRVSKQLDPDGKGVNILLYLKDDNKTEAAVVAPDADMDWDELLKGVDVEVIPAGTKEVLKAKSGQR
jgi:hypothetical protein